jgi:succinoglycan biosynthesis transport protein ExoP
LKSMTSYDNLPSPPPSAISHPNGTGVILDRRLIPTPPNPFNSLPSNSDLTLRDLLHVLARRRRVMYLTLAAGMTIAVLACLLIPRRYQAFGVVELQKPSTSGLNLDTLTTTATDTETADSVSVNIELQTEVSILQSDALALRVIQALHLERNPDFLPRHTPISGLTRLFSARSSDTADDPNATLEDSPSRRQELISVFSKNLNVRTVAGTRLIRIAYSNPDRYVAAEVVNAMIQGLTDYTVQTKLTSMKQISGILEAQLGDLRKQSEELQARVAAQRKNTELYSTGAVDANGKPAVYSPTIERLTESTQALAQAEQNRVLKGAVAEIATSSNAELLSELSGTAVTAAGGQGISNSLTLIQSLRTQEATLQEQIAQDSTKFGSEYPRLVQEKASLAQTQQSLHNEVQRISERAQNDYRVALAAEAGARATYEQNRRAAQRLNDQSIDYGIAEHEAEQSENLYQDLLRRLSEAGILEGLHSSDVTIVDRALVPATPHSPNPPLILAFGMSFGIMFSIGAAFLVDATDNCVASVEEVEAMGMAPVALLPKIRRESHDPDGLYFPTKDTPHSPFSESMRRLRSSITRGGSPPKVVLVTSSCPLEGKSTVALNLAYSMAQSGNHVLLLEADLRHPVLKERLGIPEMAGLSEILSDSRLAVVPYILPDDHRLHILPAGATAAFPAELLGSTKMQSLMAQWSSEYDFIIIDSPPTLTVTDAEVLQAMADATIVVARVSTTNRVALRRTLSSLMPYARHPEMLPIGVVLNAVEPNSGVSHEYYGTSGKTVKGRRL